MTEQTAGDRAGRGGRARARAGDRRAARSSPRRPTSTRSGSRRSGSRSRSATTPRRSPARLPLRPARSRRSSPRSRAARWCPCARVSAMEGGGFGFPFGGDPEDLLRGLQEFAAQQAESVQEAQREQFATLTLNTAVELTSAALSQVTVAGTLRRAGDRSSRRDARALPGGRRARERCPPGLHARVLVAEVQSRPWRSSTRRSPARCPPCRARSCAGSRRRTSPGRRSTTRFASCGG